MCPTHSHPVKDGKVGNSKILKVGWNLALKEHASPWRQKGAYEFKTTLGFVAKTLSLKKRGPGVRGRARG